MLERRWIRLFLWSGSVKTRGLLRGACPERYGILRYAQNDRKRRARNDTIGADNDTMGLAMKRASRVQNAFGNGKH
jgi:hypothetical protein